jgi:mannose-1-phosphate guanylyltransferase/mannose-6-phosphate isomerase
MSGGSGTRLWPLSRKHHPKQFLPLVDEKSLLQNTWERLSGISDLQSPLVICNDSHRFMVAEQLRLSGVDNPRILLEPAGRNTAPAVALAALKAVEDGTDPVLLILAADHAIGNQAEFCEVVQKALPLAEEGALVTFGIVPQGPHTGYGYIRARSIEGEAGSFARAVEKFVEKPDRETAEKYLASGDYLWNSGMFMFRASRYLDELKQYRPDILQACGEALAGARQDMDFIRVAEKPFLACPEDSIDYAVMEKTDAAIVVPLDAGWSDVGSWSALWEIGRQDAAGNVTRGDVMALDAEHCYLHSEHKLLAGVGIKDLVVVDTPDALVVAHRDQVQDVKKVVGKLRDRSRSEADHHRKVYRPWGSYDSIDNGDRFQAKRIIVKPGARLSVQMHHHRAEHWIIVKGTALVRKGDEEIMLTENQSTYIPLGVVHSLENPGVIPLEMIEVQSGSYLGEDDIVRFEDHYGRVNEHS